MTDHTDAPHLYKVQRRMERDAFKLRQEMLRNGTTKIPPICGYTYKARPAPNMRPVEVVCARNAGQGTTHRLKGFCDYHDWLTTKQAANGGTQLNQALKVAAEHAAFFGKQIPKDPHTTLLEEISRTASVVEWLNDKLNQFRAEGMTDAQILTQKTIQSGIAPSVWYELFQRERDHLVKTCVMAIKAGVAEKKVQIAERQGQLIAAMMFSFIHDRELGLSPDQIIMAPQLIRKHLMALPQPEGQESKIDPTGILKQNAIEVKYGA